jgi:hypothetical protein
MVCSSSRDACGGGATISALYFDSSESHAQHAPEICLVSLGCYWGARVGMNREEIYTEHFPCTRLQSQPSASVNGRKIPWPAIFFGILHIVSSLVTNHHASSLTLELCKQRTAPLTQIASALRYTKLVLCTQEIWPTIHPKYLHPLALWPSISRLFVDHLLILTRRVGSWRLASSVCLSRR